MISNALKHQITEKLVKETGDDNWKITKTKIEARECIVFKATSSTYVHNIAIKVYRDYVKSNSILQHDVLESFGHTLNKQNTENFVPKVFGSFPEHGLFLMEWIKSPALERRLWRYFYSKEHVQDDISRTFKWLKSFHNHASLKNKKVNIEIYSRSLKKYTKNHEINKFLFKNEVFKLGIECFDNQLIHYNNFKTNHAYLHGDFTPSNVLIDDTKVTGIDIFGNQHLPIENDLALQFSYIVIEYPNMLTQSDFKLPPEKWPLLIVILDAYGYPKNPKQLGFFLIVFLYQLLRRWTIIINRSQTNRTTMLDRWRLRNTEMIVKHLSQTLLKKNI